MGEHPGTWYNALEELIPASLHGVINPSVMASWTVLIVLLVAMYLGTRRMTKVPRGWQNLWEWTYQVFLNFARTNVGPGGEKYIPYLATAFVYIFCCNVFGIIPGMISPTASLNMTVALALTTFCLVQYAGFQAHGWGYLKHFLGEPLYLAPLMLPIHVIGELAKLLSLSIRLFGNIFGEDTVVAEMMKMGIIHVTPHLILPVPFHLVMVVFAIFTGFIQAFVFTLLSAVYLSLAIGGGEHDHDHEPHAGADDPATA